MIVSGAHHTGFSVVDLDQSIEFYAMLGCEVIWQRDISDSVPTDRYFRDIVGIAGDVRAAQLGIPGSNHRIELFQYEPHQSPAELVPNQPGHAHVSFLVEDLKRAYEELRALGVRFKSEPVLITGGVSTGAWGVYFLDPNGITLELFQPVKA